MAKFIFDLDGTLTTQQIIPFIAKHFHVEEELNELSNQTLQGNIPFMEGFLRQVYILRKFSISKISDLLNNLPVHENILDFINSNNEKCTIVSDNLSCWIEKLVIKFNCNYYSSSGEVVNNKLVKITTILKKENIVQNYQRSGKVVVFIGSGNNDMEAMRLADISIASGVTHHPTRSILPFSNYLIFDENALCRQLNQLL